MSEDVVVVAELPDGLTVVSVLGEDESAQPTYQVRDGAVVLAELPTLSAVHDYLNASG